MPAPYSAKAIANYFLPKGHLTQMKLHKLVYYAHGWHLGFTQAPLLDETLEAWQYGPVVPSLYHEFGDLGASPIERRAVDFDWETMTFTEPRVDPADRFVNRLLDRVWTVYGNYTAAQLSNLTHERNSPWSVTRECNPGVRRAGIPNDVIRGHFAKRLEEDPHDG